MRLILRDFSDAALLARFPCQRLVENLKKDVEDIPAHLCCAAVPYYNEGIAPDLNAALPSVVPLESCSRWAFPESYTFKPKLELNIVKPLNVVSKKALPQVNRFCLYFKFDFLQLLSDLFELQLLDNIAAQCDRHLGKYFQRFAAFI